MKVIQEDLVINGKKYETTEVFLPKTTLLIINGSKGFIMCGALDVGIYNSEKLLPREVICAKVIGVKTIDDMLAATIYESSNKAASLGIVPGLKVLDALPFLT